MGSDEHGPLQTHVHGNSVFMGPPNDPCGRRIDTSHSVKHQSCFARDVNNVNTYCVCPYIFHLHRVRRRRSPSFSDEKESIRVTSLNDIFLIEQT